ncbi:MAG: hypothetical protein WAT66_04720 [Actinomycetota bacterium]
MNGRRARQRRRERENEKILILVPSIRDGSSTELKNALATRNHATVSGRCTCGAISRFSHVDDQGIGHLVMEHENDCPASDDAIRELLEEEA